MKKTTIILAVLSAAVLSSCNKEAELNTAGIEPGFIKASFRSEAGSKAILDGKTIKWDTEDYLTVYSFAEGATDPAVGNIFTKSGTEKTSNAEFAGTIVANASKAYAIYPTIVANATSSTTSALKFDPATETFTTILPEAQVLSADSFSAVSPIMACKGTITPGSGEASISGTMKNVCSFIKFTLANSSTLPIRSITVKALNGVKLSGLAEIKFDENDNPVATGREASYVSGFTTDGSAIPNGTYYLCVLPVDVTTTGLKVSLSGKDGKVYEFTTAGVKMERGDVYNIGTVDSGVTANPKLSTVFLYNPAITAESTSRLGAECDGETFYYYMLKKSGTCFLVRGGKDYIETPALEGKTLKEVNAFFKSHNSNLTTSMGIKNATGTTELGEAYLTGTFIATTTEITSGKTTKLFQSKSGTTYYFHKFELGRNGDRESPRDDLVDPEAGKAYQIRATGGNCLVQMFELVYESDSVAPPTPSGDATITAEATTTVLPGETSVTIPVTLSGCSKLTASVKAGATLSDVSLSTTDTGVTVSFKANASDDPKTVQSATIVLNATPAEGKTAPSQVEATITQGGILCLELSKDAIYSEGVKAGWTDKNLIVDAQITSEVSSVYKTLAGNEYTVKDYRFYIKSSAAYMTVTGGSATPYGYMILPAIENMTLKKIAVDFRGHKSNYKVKFVVKDADGNQLGNTIQHTAEPTTDTESVHYVILNNTLTGIYDENNLSDKTIILDANGGSPKPNTAYKLIQNGKDYNCLIYRMKLYYE